MALSPLDVNMLGRRDSLELARKRTPARHARDADGQPVLLSVGVVTEAATPANETPSRNKPATTPGRSGAMRSLGLSGSARRVRRDSPVSPIPALQVQPGDPLALGTPNSALRRPALRVPLEASGRNGADEAEPSALVFDALEFEAEPSVLMSGARRVAVVHDSPGGGVEDSAPEDGESVPAGLQSGAARRAAAECEEEEEGLASFPALDDAPLADGGSVVRLQPVKASARARSELGAKSVLTPVRRSARTEPAGAPREARALLEATEFAYAPNPALLPQPAARPTPTPTKPEMHAVAAAVATLAAATTKPAKPAKSAEPAEPRSQPRRSRRVRAEE